MKFLLLLAFVFASTLTAASTSGLQQLAAEVGSAAQSFISSHTDRAFLYQTVGALLDTSQVPDGNDAAALASLRTFLQNAHPDVATTELTPDQTTALQAALQVLRDATNVADAAEIQAIVSTLKAVHARHASIAPAATAVQTQLSLPLTTTATSSTELQLGPRTHKTRFAISNIDYAILINILSFLLGTVPKKAMIDNSRPLSLMKLYLYGHHLLPARYGLKQFLTCPSAEQMYYLFQMSRDLHPYIGTEHLANLFARLHGCFGAVASEISVFNAVNAPGVNAPGVNCYLHLDAFTKSIGRGTNIDGILAKILEKYQVLSKDFQFRPFFRHLRDVNLVYAAHSKICTIPALAKLLCLWDTDQSRWDEAVNTTTMGIFDHFEDFLYVPFADYAYYTIVKAPEAQQIYLRNANLIDSLNNTDLRERLFIVNTIRFASRPEMDDALNRLVEALIKTSENQLHAFFNSILQIVFSRSDLADFWNLLAERIEPIVDMSLEKNVWLIVLRCTKQTLLSSIRAPNDALGLWLDVLHDLQPCPLRSASIEAVVKSIQEVLSDKNQVQLIREATSSWIGSAYRLAHSAPKHAETANALRNCLLQSTYWHSLSTSRHRYLFWHDIDLGKEYLQQFARLPRYDLFKALKRAVISSEEWNLMHNEGLFSHAILDFDDLDDLCAAMLRGVPWIQIQKLLQMLGFSNEIVKKALTGYGVVPSELVHRVELLSRLVSMMIRKEAFFLHHEKLDLCYYTFFEFFHENYPLAFYTRVSCFITYLFFAPLCVKYYTILRDAMVFGLDFLILALLSAYGISFMASHLTAPIESRILHSNLAMYLYITGALLLLRGYESAVFTDSICAPPRSFLEKLWWLLPAILCVYQLQNLSLLLRIFTCGWLDIPISLLIAYETVSGYRKVKMQRSATLWLAALISLSLAVYAICRLPFTSEHLLPEIVRCFQNCALFLTVAKTIPGLIVIAHGIMQLITTVLRHLDIEP